VVVLRRRVLLLEQRCDLLLLDVGLVWPAGWSSGVMMSNMRKTWVYFMFCEI
jgi:hypothetical protein